MKQYKYIIYALQDPITYEIRYIGKSGSGLLRPKAHIIPSRLQSCTHKNHWIKSLLKQGLRPIIKVVQELSNFNELNTAEIYWIQYFKDIGCLLTNSTKGGMGRCGLPHTEETKRKISEGQKNKKVARGPSHGMYGRKRTKEEKALISEHTKIGMNKNEVKEKMHKKPSANKFIDQSGQYYESIYDCRRKTGLSRDTIREILNGQKESYNGYKFTYISKTTVVIPLTCQNHFTKKIMDQNGVIYFSIREAAKQLNLSEGSISQNLRGRSKQTKGYSFKEIV